MKQTLYKHLVDLSDLEAKLSAYGLLEREVDELYGMIKEIIHCRIAEEILTHLPADEHQWFLEKYSSLPHEKSFLSEIKKRIVGIEKKIRIVVDKVKSELLEEL